MRAAESLSEGSVLERIEQLEKKLEAPAMWQRLGLKLSGLVDVAYTQNFHNPASDLNQLRTFDTNANAFMPHLFQLMVERPAEGGGSALERVGFRGRLNFGLDARVTRARTNYQTGTSNDEVDLQEVYAQYILPIANGLDIKVGKMNTLIGYEVINSPDNVNFSRSFTFGFGQAFTTTGLRLSYQFNPLVLASVGVVNGWDNVDDNNRGKTVEWLLALTLTSNMSLSIYGSYGPEQANRSFGDPASGGALPGNPSATRLASGVVLTLKATEKDLFILEPFYANETHASTIQAAQNARWNSVVGRWIHDFTDQWSLRGRGEIFEDAGGTRTCLGTFNTAGGTNTCFGATNTTPAPSQAQTLWETTWTLQYRPVPALITRLEFRYDKSDKNVFQHGAAASNNQETLGVQVLYLF
ncbi:outer membrane beta-barrel protein [Nitrospira sp. NS4]|uniref:outer membrane beta-barrel protein n=1 Tax=Nitrospira sp. NS4 TaxID=3414498 RepID=UPI003C2C6AC2